MYKELPKIADMEHISAQEFCDNMDAVLDRVSNDDIALVIDYKDKAYVLCPYEWFSVPQKEHFNSAMIGALRYALEHDTTTEICSTLCGSLEFLSEETKRVMSCEIATHIAAYGAQSNTIIWEELLQTLNTDLANSEVHENE